MKNKLVVLISALIISSTLIGCGNTKTSSNKSQDQNVAVATEQTSNINYYFSKDNGQPDKQLIDVINNSKSTMNIAIYSLTKADIVNAIIDAKKRGVDVKIITDKIESSTKSESKELKLLKNAGIPIKINSHKGLMHMKVTVADKAIVTTGSYNYTQAATKENDEVLVVIKDTSAAEKFTTEFERMWNDTSNFKNY